MNVFCDGSAHLVLQVQAVVTAVGERHVVIGEFALNQDYGGTQDTTSGISEFRLLELRVLGRHFEDALRQKSLTTGTRMKRRR